MCLHGSARLAAMRREGTFELSGPHHYLPNKVVSRQRMPYPRSCSLRYLRGGTSSDLRYIVAAPPDRV
jgi:hypothetical protein